MGASASKTFIRTGALAPTLAKLSLPILAGQLFSLLYNLVDTYFIARIDTANPWLVGATGLVWPVYFIFMATGFGITGGVASLVARAIGANKESELDRTAESGLFLALLIGAASLILIYPIAAPLLKLFGGQNELLEYGLKYLYWLLPTVPFMMMSAVFTGILQGEGRTKHMMAAMMIGTIINIVLDPVLIFTARMGIAGAGLATAIGNAAGFLYLLIVFLRTKSTVTIHWKARNISPPVVIEIIRVGLPQSLSNFLASISFIFYNRIMIDINPLILTAFTLYSRLEQVALIPIWSLGGALSAVAGQAAGAGGFTRMKKSSATASWMGLSVSGTLFVLFVLSSGRLFALFQSDPAVLDLTSRIVIWMAATSFLSIPMFMIGTVMSVAGFASRSFSLTAIRIYLLNVPACAIGAYLIGKNIDSAMVAIFISGIVALVMFLFAGKHFFSGLEAGRLRVKQLA